MEERKNRGQGEAEAQENMISVGANPLCSPV
ncbi:MAG: hypothetical protein QG657_4031 [Acidobacteriota bacterium]|nr:hypothetical protein [Acidobacteriota bacterium]